MSSRRRIAAAEAQRYRTLAIMAMVYLAALPLATLWDLVNRIGVGPKQLLFIAAVVLVVGGAAAVTWLVGARAGFVTAVWGGYVVVAFGMYHDAGSAGVTWAAFIGLVALVALSPANRWTTAAAAAGSVCVAVVCVALRLEGADPAFSDPFKAGTIACLLFGFGVLARGVACSMWERGRAADAARDHLEAAIDHAAVAQEWLSASLRDLVGDMETEGRTPFVPDALRRIIGAADAATVIVDEMLEASRVRSGVADLQREPVDPALLAGAEAEVGKAVVVADPVYLAKALRAAAGADAAWSVTADGAEVVLVAATPQDTVPGAREVADGIVEAHGGHVAWTAGVVEVHMPDADAVAAHSHGLAGPDHDAWQEAWGHAITGAARSAAPWIGAALALTALGLVTGRTPGSLPGLIVCAALWPLVFVVPRFTELRGGYVASILVHTAVVAGLVASSGGIAGALWVLILVPAGMTIVLERWKMVLLGAVATLAMAAAVIPTMPEYTVAVDVPLVLPLFTVLMLVPASRGFDRIAAEIEAANADLAARRREAITFLTVIAHELRTPLTSVRGSAESLLLGGWPPAMEAEFADTIRQECARLASLVDDLDAGAERRLERTRVVPEVFALAVVVDAAVSGAAAAANAHGHTVVGGVAPELAVAADPDLVREVLDNLLSNAIRYSPPRTPVSVAAAPEVGTDTVRVEVVDHGPGVVPGDRENVFDRYWRATGAPGHGTGLGLAIARALVESHGEGARIWCEATPGGGATFAFTLPMAPAAAGVAATPTRRT